MEKLRYRKTFLESLKGIAQGFVDSMTLGIDFRRRQGLPANLEDGGTIDDNLVDIFNDAFPDNDFTKENIKEKVKNSGITNGELMAILEAYSWVKDTEEPRDLVSAEIKAKFTKIS